MKEALKRHEESYPVELEGHGSPFYSLVSLSLQVVTDVSLSMKKETFNLYLSSVLLCSVSVHVLDSKL